MTTPKLLSVFFMFLFILSGTPVAAANPPKASDIINDPNVNLDPLGGRYTTPGAVIFDLLKYLLVFSGLILFFMIIAGGYQLMFGAGDPKQAEAGKTRITQALIGFIIIFTAYWITQIIEVMLGVNIL